MHQPNQPPAPHPLSGKLVLPAVPNEDDMSLRASRPLQAFTVRPEQLILRNTPPPPTDPLARLRYFWGKDPAYKVFMIAVGTVLIAGLFLFSLVSASLLRNGGSFAGGNSLSQTPPTAVVSRGTVDVHPTFPPPGGGKGSGTSSQPPTQGTPVLQATQGDTSTPQPTPGGNGQLTVQLNGVPAHVQNYSTIPVTVTTSEPNVTVDLYVIYNVSPYRYISGSRTTDANGNSTIYWTVNVFMFGRHAQAMVYTVAVDQNGQRAQAQPISVQIVGVGGGG